MQLPIKPLLKRVRKDGTANIYIQYCYSSASRILLDSEISIPAMYWNRKKNCVSKGLPENFRNHDDLNRQIVQIIRIVEDLVELTKRMKVPDPLTFIKKHYKPNLDNNLLKEIEFSAAAESGQQTNNIFLQIDDYINSKKDKVSKDMPRIYRNMKDHLKTFELHRKEPITFDCLDFNFYEEFVQFLSCDYIHKRRKEIIYGLKINTVGKTIKQFRTFLRNRIRKRIIPPLDLEGWKILEEEVDAVYCNWNEINIIYNVDLTSFPHLEDYRNDFVLGCLTALRFSDFSHLEEHDVRGEMLYKKQQKSNHWVVVPLRQEAIEILENRFKKNLQPATNGKSNRHIKTIAKLAGINSLIKHSYKKRNRIVEEVKPKYAYITSHTCRRSFCTNEFLAGTPVELIMKISGHKSVKDFYKYIRITPEEAGQKIKELWKNRGGMNAFAKENNFAYNNGVT